MKSISQELNQKTIFNLGPIIKDYLSKEENKSFVFDCLKKKSVVFLNPFQNIFEDYYNPLTNIPLFVDLNDYNIFDNDCFDNSFEEEFLTILIDSYSKSILDKTYSNCLLDNQLITKKMSGQCFRIKEIIEIINNVLYIKTTPVVMKPETILVVFNELCYLLLDSYFSLDKKQQKEDWSSECNIIYLCYFITIISVSQFLIFDKIDYFYSKGFLRYSDKIIDFIRKYNLLSFYTKNHHYYCNLRNPVIYYDEEFISSLDLNIEFITEKVCSNDKDFSSKVFLNLYNKFDFIERIKEKYSLLIEEELFSEESFIDFISKKSIGSYNKNQIKKIKKIVSPLVERFSK